MIRKFHFIFVLFLVSLCFACPSNSNTLTKINSLKSLNGTWDLMTIDKNGVKENNPSKDRTVTLTFKDDESTGEISGKDICGNTVFGDYTLSPTNSVKIDRFGGTKIGCSGWASDFWGLIREAVAYEVDNEQLKIYFNDNSNVLIFKRT